MEMDLTVTEYPTYDDLLDYMEGSAAAIGTMMLPILGTSDPAAAHEPARQLGFAFQLTNFIRAVGEDLDRGRIYLPRKDLADAGVTPEDLRARQFTAPIRELIAAEAARARVHYAFAAPGIPLLAPGSQACIRTAYRLVVVGAGLGGLSCALHLAAAGREVTVVEKETVPGGRAGRLTLDGYEFDTGPAVITMPDLIEEALGAVGERLADWVELRPVDPAYRAHFPDGSTLDVIADPPRMSMEVARVC